MAIIPNDEQFVGVSSSIDMTERKSSRLNNATQVYTLQDFSDSLTTDLTPITVDGNSVSIASDPTATTQAMAVIQSSTLNSGIAIVPNGTGAITAQVPDGTATGGNARGINAVDLQISRNLNTEVASGDYGAVIMGGQQNTASGWWSVVGGGFRNKSSSTNSTIAGGDRNNATALRSTIGGGKENNATSESSTVSGGQSNTATSGTHATVVGGKDNTSSGQYSCSGGNGSIASGQGSFSFGNISGGNANSATGGGSVAIGNGNRALAAGAVAMGTQSYVTGADAVGIGRQARAEGDFAVAFSKNSATSNYSTVSGGQSNTASTGSHATVVGGYDNTSSGQYSVSGGNTNTVSGAESTAFGFGNSVSTSRSFAVGMNNSLSGLRRSFAIGEANTVTGFDGSTAIGKFNNVSGEDGAMGLGSINTVSGRRGVALGGDNNVSGDFSGAYGFTNTVSTTNSFAYGKSNNLFSQDNTIALGYDNKVSAPFAIATGKRGWAYLYGQQTQASEWFTSPPEWGNAQASSLIARKSDDLTTGGTTVLSLDGTGTTNLIIPNPNVINSAWNVTVEYVGVCTAAGSGTTAVGDVVTGTDKFRFKRVGGTSTIGSVTNIELTQDATMTSAECTYAVGGSNDLQISFAAPTTANATTFRVVAKVSLVEVAW